MHPITLRLSEDTLAELEEEAEARDMSRSEYIRSVIDARNEYDELQADYDRLRAEYERKLDELRDEYEERIEELETENERLRREKRMILEQREEHTELVRYASTEKAYREAGLGTRMKWFLFGRND